MEERKLTEKQETFLLVLFHEAGGDFNKAKKLAGYSENVSTKSIVDSLKDEIFEATKEYIVTNGVKAAVSITKILDDPTQLGAKNALAAAKDVLDRAGHKPSDKVEVKAESPLFILPQKNAEDI